MSENGQDKVIAFDTLYTNNHIQKLKILMPYFDLPTQSKLAVYIKFLELQYTIAFFQNNPSATLSKLTKEASFDIPKLCGEIIPFCNPSEKAELENMRNMFQTFENLKGMMEMMQTMKELFPESEGSMNPDFLSQIAGMAGMGGMPGMGGMSSIDGFDFSQIFEMFQTMSDSGGDEGGNEQTRAASMDE